MITTRDDVLRFMNAGDQTNFGFGDQSDLYLKLITEELIHETLKGFDKNDIVEIADGIADSIWVIEGFAITVNVSLEKVWRQISYLRDCIDDEWYDDLDNNIIIEDIIRVYASLRECYRMMDTGYLLFPIVDLINGLISLAITYNIPLQEIWDEVSRSNMSKISDNGKVIKNEFGKIQKPATFSPANIRAILEKHNLV